MELREPPLGAMSGRRYSAAQIYLIRQRLRAYYEMKKAQVGPSFNWNSVAELLHLVIEEIEGTEETELRIKGERLRQIATGQISRGAPSGTTDENLDLIVRFLTHPDIGSLTLEDLNEPDLPYQFALQLMEFLRHDEHSDLALPPGNLKGRYRAVVRSGGEISDIRVDIIISRDGNLVHVINRQTYSPTRALEILRIGLLTNAGIISTGTPKAADGVFARLKTICCVF